MKAKHIEEAKQLLKKAYMHLPADYFGLREVRFHVMQALQKIDKVENKQDNRQKQNQLENERREKVAGPYNINAIDIIDKMIAEEERKLNAKKQVDDTSEDDGDIQTFHG